MRSFLLAFVLLAAASLFAQSIAVNGSSIVVQDGAVMIDASIARPASSFLPTNPANASLPRALPPGFPTLPVMPKVVRGPGDVELNESLAAAFVAKYGASITGGIAWVDPINGSDSTGVVGNAAKPFATISKPLRYTSAQIVLLADGVYTPFDFRYSDAFGKVVKMVACENTGRCVIQVSGSSLASAPWSASTYSGVYVAKIASDGVTSGPINRVLYQDGTTDSAGFPQRLPLVCYNASSQVVYAYYSACATSNSLAALQTGGYGWYYDSPNHLLYVALKGADLTQATTSGRIRATYYDVQHNARILAYGSTLLAYGLYLDGIDVQALEFKNGSAYMPSEVWVINSTYFASGGGDGAQVVGSRYFEQGVTSHAVLYDGTNGNNGAAGYLSLILSANSEHDDAGDVETFGASALAIYPRYKGETSEGGYEASFGSIYTSDFGPELGSASLGTANLTWVVGSIARNVQGGDPGPAGFAFYGVGTGSGSSRTAWLDTCSASNEGADALLLDSGAAAKVFNSTFDTMSYTNGSTAPAQYTPGAP
jgi:hypothetical protein